MQGWVFCSLNSVDTKYKEMALGSTGSSLILILCHTATINEDDAMSLTLSTKHQQCCPCRSPPYYGVLGSSQRRTRSVDWASDRCFVQLVLFCLTKDGPFFFNGKLLCRYPSAKYL